MLVDAQVKQKHFAMKDADGHYLGGPISDWTGGGRWYAKIPPGGQALVWVLFEPVTAGSKMTVQVPLMFPFDDVVVTEGAPASGQQVAASVPPLTARLVSAKRSEGQLKVQVKISNPGKTVPSGSTVRYADTFVFDPTSKQKYLLLKDTEGVFLAQPISDKNDGGRWFASSVRPGADALMSLIFPAPPDSVQQVDIMIPGFAPFEAVSITGTGGGSASGVGVAGKSLGLEGVLKELNAEVTPEEIKINLAADVLFDFDKADLKPAAEPSLEKVVTVLKAYPAAQVQIDGHTDGKGDASYNQGLSERRAASVAKWLGTHSALSAANFHTKGWGATKPVAPNTKPDGSDNPEGREKNRRVEIVVTRNG
jgi:outer membrane protein OmpA-like peptidoglycan-associated protein